MNYYTVWLLVIQFLASLPCSTPLWLLPSTRARLPCPSNIMFVIELVYFKQDVSLGKASLPSTFFFFLPGKTGLGKASLPNYIFFSFKFTGILKLFCFVFFFQLIILKQLYLLTGLPCQYYIQYLLFTILPYRKAICTRSLLTDFVCLYNYEF